MDYKRKDMIFLIIIYYKMNIYLRREEHILLCYSRHSLYHLGTAHYDNVLKNQHASKSELWNEEEFLKDKSGSSEKSKSLGDESMRLICGLSKKETDISDSYISKGKSI